MSQRFVGIFLALIAGNNALGKNPLPKDVPPVLAIAVVSDPGKADLIGEWKIRLTLPKVTWQVVGKEVPKKQWPELKAEIEKASLTLHMGGPSQLVPSKIVDLRGKKLEREEVIERLKKETPVLVSVSGRKPDPYYLQLTNPNTLIVVLGARDNYPAPQYLPAKKVSSSKSE